MPEPELPLNRRILLSLPLTIASALSVCATPHALATPSNAEAVSIEDLIRRVSTMSRVSFIRNGVEANAADAAKHLRDKYDYFRRDIGSAEDFIRLCGTRSEVTHRPYMVRLADGKERTAADFLTDELRQIQGHSR